MNETDDLIKTMLEIMILLFNDPMKTLSNAIKMSIPWSLVQMERRESTAVRNQSDVGDDSQIVFIE